MIYTKTNLVGSSSCLCAGLGHPVGMSQVYQLMSMMDDPTHPLGFSSLKNGSSTVDILSSGDLFAVFEENPVCLLNAMDDMQGRPRTNTMFQHPYSLAVYYRKSVNPHGPSTRPVFIATFEFSPMTCRTRGVGFLGALMGEKGRPAEAYMIGNYPGGRVNDGLRQLNFSAAEACRSLADFSQRALKLAEPFRRVGQTTVAWDPKYTE